uniref:C-type lectin domain-containing protein n=1 Tax=Mola mola TaxID=94237 RepID=A0A3Q3WG61_MOLML
MVAYVLYGVVVLLLLVLLMVTGISCMKRDTEQWRTQDVRGPGEGWVSFQSSCYLLSTSTSMWSGAEEACQRLGAHLLVVNSREELVSTVGLGSHHWIGLVEWHQEGNWTWVDGTDYNLTPKFWAPNQPDNWALRKNGEDCGEIYNNLPLSRQIWNDADCSLKHRYICESR